MAEDWAADVKKYVTNADDNAIAGIIRYCGIALTKRDSSLVSFSDKTETDRVRNNFLKKKLARTEDDSVLDAAIAAVGDLMKADRTKNRVTVYYLLAEKFGSLALFHKAANAKIKAPAKAAGAAADKKPAAKAAPKSAAAGAAAAGGAALGLAALSGDDAKAAEPAKAAAPAPAANDGLGTKAAVALGATGAAVTGVAASLVSGAGTAADKAGDAISNVAGAAADTAGKAGDMLSDAAGAAADTAGKAGAVVAGAAGAAALGAAALAGKATGALGDAGSSITGAASGLLGGDDEDGSGNWLWWLLAGALVLAAIWWFFLRSPADADGGAVAAASTEAVASTAATGTGADLAAAPAEGSVAIPAGAGVTSELRDGKPVVKVYFDTGKTNVAPAFAPAAGGLKAYLDGHAGSKLAVSGFADPTGNAAQNTALSKRRAEAVQTQLVAGGIPATAIELVKPEASTDATVEKSAARRVEVVVK